MYWHQQLSYTPKAIVNEAVQAYEKQGFEVALNSPFAGTLIPSSCWQKNAGVMGMVIEIRRDLYMTEYSEVDLQDVSFNDNSEIIRMKVCAALKQIVKYLPTMAS